MNPTDILTTTVKQRRAELSFADVNVKSIQQWADKLLEMPLGQACLQLWQGVQQIRELNCDEKLRFKFLQILDGSFDCLTQDLYAFCTQHRYAQQQERYEQLIQLLLGLYGLMMVSYYEIAQRLDEQIQESLFIKKFNFQVYLLKASSYGLKLASTILYYNVIFDRPALKNLWFLTHQFYTLSRKNKQHKAYLKSFIKYKNDDFQVQTIIEQYKQILLFETLAAPYLSENDLKNILGYSFEWAKFLKFKSGNHAESHYRVASTQDLPIYIIHQEQFRKVKADFSVDNQKLEYYFNHRLIPNQEICISSSLKMHVHNILTEGYKRVEKRYSYTATLDAYLGFEDISQVLMAYDDKNYKPRYNIINHKLKVIDKSKGGYKLLWESSIPIYAKKGNVLLLRELSDDYQLQLWQSAVIRWTERINDQSMYLGLEVLAKQQMLVELHALQLEPELAILAYVRKTHVGESYFLLMSKNTKIKVGENVIMRIGDLKFALQITRQDMSIGQYLVKCDIKLQKVQDSDIIYTILTQSTLS